MVNRMCHNAVDIPILTSKGNYQNRRIDECISKLVEELNKHGIRTHSSSCCGHGKEDGYIFIDKDSVKEGKFGLILITKKRR